MASTFKIIQAGKQIEEITITVIAYQYCQVTVTMTEDGRETFKQNNTKLEHHQMFLVKECYLIHYSTHQQLFQVQNRNILL